MNVLGLCMVHMTRVKKNRFAITSKGSQTHRTQLFLKTQAPKLDQLFNSIKNKEATVSSVKDSWVKTLCSKYPLGEYRDTLTVVDYVVEQYYDSESDNTTNNEKPLFHVDYLRKTNCGDCSEEKTSIMHKSHGPWRAVGNRPIAVAGTQK